MIAWWENKKDIEFAGSLNGLALLYYF